MVVISWLTTRGCAVYSKQSRNGNILGVYLTYSNPTLPYALLWSMFDFTFT